MKSSHLVEFGEKQGVVTESWDLLVGEKLGRPNDLRRRP